MVRQVVALLVLCGCDLAAGIDHIDPAIALCGPYGAPEPVAFDAALQGATDLSVAADGMHGIVNATYMGKSGPVPIVFDGTTWAPDAARYAAGALASNLDAAHIGVSGNDAYGWIDHRRTGTPAIYEYDYTTTWSQVVPDLNDSSTLDLFTGQEVESPDTSNPMVKSRYVVEIFEMFGGGPPHKIEILAAGPASNVWKPSGFVDPLNKEASIDIVGGALTGDHKILVYVASDLSTTITHLYETKLAHDEFQVGTVMSSLEAFGKTDDQPYLSPDCSTIWFRRDGVTQVARKM